MFRIRFIVSSIILFICSENAFALNVYYYGENGTSYSDIITDVNIQYGNGDDDLYFSTFQFDSTISTINNRERGLGYLGFQVVDESKKFVFSIWSSSVANKDDPYSGAGSPGLEAIYVMNGATFRPTRCIAGESGCVGGVIINDDDWEPLRWYTIQVKFEVVGDGYNYTAYRLDHETNETLKIATLRLPSILPDRYVRPGLRNSPESFIEIFETPANGSHATQNYTGMHIRNMYALNSQINEWNSPSFMTYMPRTVHQDPIGYGKIIPNADFTTPFLSVYDTSPVPPDFNPEQMSKNPIPFKNKTLSPPRIIAN